jgi:hypothetical protein
VDAGRRPSLACGHLALVALGTKSSEQRWFGRTDMLRIIRVITAVEAPNGRLQLAQSGRT